MTGIPRATLRLQLHAGYTLDDAADQVDYFARLGISHLYTSPITRARRGSMHGYDTIDHQTVSPELGGLSALRRLAGRLRTVGMGLIIDIVPNHMAACHENAWWRDVMAHGPASDYARYFDIDWEPGNPALHGKLLAPYLGQQYGEELKAGKLQLTYGESGYEVAYYDVRFPVAPASYPLIWSEAPDTPPSLADLAPQLAQLDQPISTSLREATRQQWQTARRDPGVAAFLARSVSAFNTGDIIGQANLHTLLEQQHYRLAWWRTAAEEINWRRFFEINDLIAVRVDREPVFAATHALIASLYAEGLIDGVRIDHVDGIADPACYCARLRQCLEQAAAERPAGLSREPYIVAEKILGADEPLDPRWPIHGTSGYEFMDLVSGVLHNAGAAWKLDALWRKLADTDAAYDVQLAAARRQVLAQHFCAEHERLVNALHAVAQQDPATRDWTHAALQRVTTELLVFFPVYRCYATSDGRSPQDDAFSAQAVQAARDRLQPDDQKLLEQVDLWLGAEAPATVPAAIHETRLEAIRCYQQLTAPLAAKALEDTLFFRYGRLLSRNEVGAAPAHLAYDTDHFHRAISVRTHDWPYAMLATATHDHKRGEDARARLACLTDYPYGWSRLVRKWLAHVPDAPHAADQYMLLQTLVAAWPPELGAADHAGITALVERITRWQIKALRESKLRSSWFQPDQGYEDRCIAFLNQRMLDPQEARYRNAVGDFVERIAPAAALKGLSQLVLRTTTPGVPDTYQGTEFWDHSLTDPDNRQPVDYAARIAALDAQGDDRASWRDGRIKQALLQHLLGLRARHPALFALGGYQPLRLTGAASGAALAYLRSHADQHAMVIVPLRCPGPVPALPQVPPKRWGDTAVVLPATLSDRVWIDTRTNEEWIPYDGVFMLSALLRTPSVGVLMTRGSDTS